MLRAAMPATTTSTKLRLAVAIAAASGFIALSYEIVWYRVLSVMTRGTAPTFGLLLAAYLFGLAFGSWGAGRACRDDAGGDPRTLSRLAWFVTVANVLAALVAPVCGWTARFTDYRAGLFAVALAAAFLGAVLPLVSHFGVTSGSRSGQQLSYVYLANIIGSTTGSLLTGFLLLDVLSLASICTLLAVLGLGLAAALVVASGIPRAVAARHHLAFAALAASALVAVPRLYDRIWERIVYKWDYDDGKRFQQVVENKSGVILVAQDGTVYGGGAYDGVVNTRLDENDKNGILRAYVLGGFHPAPRHVLMVGLASGSWAQVVANLPGVERMTIIEINPGYLEVIARHPEVAGLLRNPKVELVFDDGRRWMQRHDERFDVLVMNTTLHWRGHATNLLSTEFMDIARRHLRPGGIFYFNTTDSYDVQLTAANAFKGFVRVANFALVSDDASLVFDRARWKTVLDTMTIDGTKVLDRSLPRHQVIYDALLGYNDIEYRDTVVARTLRAGAKVITDDGMVVEWRDPFRYPKKEDD